MNNIDFTILDGNLTHDPEMRNLKNDSVVTTFNLAVNHERHGQEGNKYVSYIPIETWDRLAENCATYLARGSRVTVSGELRQDRWKDDEGRTRSKLKVLARTVRFDTPPKKEEEDGEE